MRAVRGAENRLAKVLRTYHRGVASFYVPSANVLCTSGAKLYQQRLGELSCVRNT